MYLENSRNVMCSQGPILEGEKLEGWMVREKKYRLKLNPEGPSLCQEILSLTVYRIMDSKTMHLKKPLRYRSEADLRNNRSDIMWERKSRQEKGNLLK